LETFAEDGEGDDGEDGAAEVADYGSCCMDGASDRRVGRTVVD